MIRSFHDNGTEDVFHGIDSKSSRKTLPRNLAAIARRKLDQLNQAVRLEDLKAPPNNRLEALKRERRGQHAIRINDQYRVCFVWTETGPDRVEIADYH